MDFSISGFLHNIRCVLSRKSKMPTFTCWSVIAARQKRNSWWQQCARTQKKQQQRHNKCKLISNGNNTSSCALNRAYYYLLRTEHLCTRLFLLLDVYEWKIAQFPYNEYDFSYVDSPFAAHASCWCTCDRVFFLFIFVHSISIPLFVCKIQQQKC